MDLPRPGRSRAAQDLVAEGNVWSLGRTPARSMSMKERREQKGSSFWAKAAIREDQEAGGLEGLSRNALREREGRRQRA